MTTHVRRSVAVTVTAAVCFVTLVGVPAGAQSLEEQTRRPPGTNSLDDDSQHLRDAVQPEPHSDSQDDDSMRLRGRTADQDGTNSLDDGVLDGGDGDGDGDGD